jgi:hypothetical protein
VPLWLALARPRPKAFLVCIKYCKILKPTPPSNGRWVPQSERPFAIEIKKCRIKPEGRALSK